MAAMTETPRAKAGWAVANIIVLLYAFIPIVWIISLSLKGDDTLNDGKYLPANPTSEAYTTIFNNDDFVRSLRSMNFLPDAPVGATAPRIEQT